MTQMATGMEGANTRTLPPWRPQTSAQRPTKTTVGGTKNAKAQQGAKQLMPLVLNTI